MIDLSTLKHRNGVWWYDAPLPRRLHRCWAQTSCWDGLDYVQRCACGAIRYHSVGRGNVPWIDRNSRRRSA